MDVHIKICVNPSYNGYTVCTNQSKSCWNIQSGGLINQTTNITIPRITLLMWLKLHDLKKSIALWTQLLCSHWSFRNPHNCNFMHVSFYHTVDVCVCVTQLAAMLFAIWDKHNFMLNISLNSMQDQQKNISLVRSGPEFIKHLRIPTHVTQGKKEKKCSQNENDTNG